MNQAIHPRVLFVTPHAFNHVTGGGITYSSLFHGWPTHCLATAHNDPVPTSDDVCHNYYRLGPAEIDFVWPLSQLRRPASESAEAAPGTTATASGGAYGRAKRCAVGIFGDPLPRRARLTDDLMHWIADYEPQLLYTILGDNAMMDLVDTIRRQFRLPLVVHIMDDWPAASYRSGALGPLMRRGMARRLRRLFAIATQRFVISPAMADAYAARYGMAFEVFQNTIDVAARGVLARPDAPVGDPATILYVGSIFPNAQLHSLVDCARAVIRLADAGRAAQLHIVSPAGQTAQFRRQIASHPAIVIENTIENDDAFFRRIAAADLLLLPVNFDADSIRFIRYSMPTKVPAYLVSGTPILAYGPTETAQIAYAESAGWAFVVGTRDIGALAAGIDNVLHNIRLRRSLTDAAQRNALENHDARQVRTQFQTLIRLSGLPSSNLATNAVAP